MTEEKRNRLLGVSKTIEKRAQNTAAGALVIDTSNCEVFSEEEDRGQSLVPAFTLFLKRNFVHTINSDKCTSK